MKNNLIGIIFLTLSQSSVGTEFNQSPSFFHEHQRGWFWYETLPKENSPDLKKDPMLSPKQILKSQGERWENSLSHAILDPSTKNVQQYLEQTKRIQEQAQKFSHSFKETIWTQPSFDYSLEKPDSTQGIIASNEQEQFQKDLLLKKYAKKFGLIFFFSGTCPHCQRFAPILKKFIAQYKFEVIPVTIDKQSLPEFPNPQMNLEIGQRLNVSTVPAVFLVDPLKNQVTPISYGYVDWTGFIEKLLVATDKEQSEMVEK